MTLFLFPVIIKLPRFFVEIKPEDTAQMKKQEIKIYGKNSNTYFNIVSRALSELANAKLVKVVNPKSRTGRLYTLTNKGKKALNLLKNL